MLYALHGFMGLPSDWDVLQMPDLVACDITSIGKPSSSFGLWEWAQKFNDTLSPAQKPVLMGYSLGGRLALHALLLNPAFWSGVIIISANPGLNSSLEKEQRYREDEVWTERFLHESWPSLLQAWNGREAFANAHFSFERNEQDYVRSTLANALRWWSVGRQEFLIPQIASINVPILWIAGENDKRYAAAAKELSFRHARSRVWIAPCAGHRVPWETSTLFKKQTLSFIEEL